jgi:ankyrin repeat protein
VAGSDVNEPNGRGWTLLHHAAYAKMPDIVDFLVAKVRPERGGARLGRDPADRRILLKASRGRGSTETGCGSPKSIRAAARLGELVEASFDPDGTMTPEAGSAAASTARIAYSGLTSVH